MSDEPSDDDHSSIVKEVQIQYLSLYARAFDRWVDRVIGSRESVHWFNRESEMQGMPIIEDDVHINNPRVAAERLWDMLRAAGKL